MDDNWIIAEWKRDGDVEFNWFDYGKFSAPFMPVEIGPRLWTPGDQDGGSDLRRAECLWAELQEDKLGSYSGINRPFWIAHAFAAIRADERGK